MTFLDDFAATQASLLANPFARALPQALYIHVPFCHGTCAYCDFYHVSPRKDRLYDDFIPRYLQGIDLELERTQEILGRLWPQPQSKAPSRHPSQPQSQSKAQPEPQSQALPQPQSQAPSMTTLYLGGGTPSLLRPQDLTQLLAAVQGVFSLAPSCEITMEANPESLDAQPDLAATMADLGVNRVSLGLQSEDDAMLCLLHRRHDRSMFEEALQILQHAGFSNISIDLIYGLPDQTLASWERTLTYAASLPITHISLYSLVLAEDTLLGTWLKDPEKADRFPDYETNRAMLDLAHEHLSEAGFTFYEISSAAKDPAYFSRHNQVYWRADPYFALGPGASAYWGGMRMKNPSHFERWYQSLAAGAWPAQVEETIDLEGAKKEFMLLGLRLAEGVSACRYRTLFGSDMEKDFGPALQELCAKGYLVREEAKSWGETIFRGEAVALPTPEGREETLSGEEVVYRPTPESRKDPYELFMPFV